MRNSSEIWCETSDICIALIEERANVAWQRGEFPTMVYLSLDLYTELQRLTAASARYTGNSINTGVSGVTLMGINTSAGQLNIQPVNRLRNFLLVSRREDFDAMRNEGFDQIFWSDQEIARVGKAFEDIILEEE